MKNTDAKVNKAAELLAITELKNNLIGGNQMLTEALNTRLRMQWGQSYFEARRELTSEYILLSACRAVCT